MIAREVRLLSCSVVPLADNKCCLYRSSCFDSGACWRKVPQAIVARQGLFAKLPTPSTCVVLRVWRSAESLSVLGNNRTREHTLIAKASCELFVI
jgi:hypothetical protein